MRRGAPPRWPSDRHDLLASHGRAGRRRVALDAGDAAARREQALLAAADCDTVESRVEASISRTLAGRALGAAGRQDEAIAVLERAAGELEGYGAVRHRQAAEQELRKLGRRVHRRSAPARRTARCSRR